MCTVPELPAASCPHSHGQLLGGYLAGHGLELLLPLSELLLEHLLLSRGSAELGSLDLQLPLQGADGTWKVEVLL